MTFEISNPKMKRKLQKAVNKILEPTNSLASLDSEIFTRAVAILKIVFLLLSLLPNDMPTEFYSKISTLKTVLSCLLSYFARYSGVLDQLIEKIIDRLDHSKSIS